MHKRRTNPDYLNGVPELVVLKLLAERPMYGYELVRAVRDASDQSLDFGEGCIYPLLHKLEERGDLASRRMVVGGRSRVVYRVTPGGGHTFKASAKQWNRITGAISSILQGGEDAKPRVV